MASYDHWMRLNIGDYLGDTLHLTTLQHGMYFLLLMHYFKRRELPDDEQALAQIARMRVDYWRRWSPSVMALFTRQDGRWRHKRLDAELEQAVTKSRVSITKDLAYGCENRTHKPTFPYQKPPENGGNPTRARARPRPELELERKKGVARVRDPGAPAGAPPPKGFQSRPKADGSSGAAACRAIAREDANARSERIHRGEGADRTDPPVVARTLRVVG